MFSKFVLFLEIGIKVVESLNIPILDSFIEKIDRKLVHYSKLKFEDKLKQINEYILPKLFIFLILCLLLLYKNNIYTINLLMLSFLIYIIPCYYKEYYDTEYEKSNRNFFTILFLIIVIFSPMFLIKCFNFSREALILFIFVYIVYIIFILIIKKYGKIIFFKCLFSPIYLIQKTIVFISKHNKKSIILILLLVIIYSYKFLKEFYV